MPSSPHLQNGIDRRHFLGASASCAGHIALLASGLPVAAWASGGKSPVAREPWGALEKIGDGLWALISTPLSGDYTTLCNGGIVAGRDGVLLVESFATAKGASWMARQARELTGRWPTHVVLTHFHGDHTNGLEGFVANALPRILSTARTRDLVRDADDQRDLPPESPRSGILAGLSTLEPATPSEVDLGGRVVTVVPREGHTPSDVTVELDEPSVVWCGDLVWNGMFPNYRDAIPSRLSRDVRALARARETVYVPGHGPLATPHDLERYVAVIDQVEAAARRAFEQGTPAAEAAKAFAISPALGEWLMFTPQYYEVALRAWERELGASR